MNGEPMARIGPADMKAFNRAVIEAAQKAWDNLCHNESPYLTPQRVFDVTGLAYYHCGLQKGHTGPHQWQAARVLYEWETS